MNDKRRIELLRQFAEDVFNNASATINQDVFGAYKTFTEAAMQMAKRYLDITEPEQEATK